MGLGGAVREAATARLCRAPGSVLTRAPVQGMHGRERAPACLLLVRWLHGALWF